ncbi:MAG: hypothetical protein WAV07_11185 [Candidatus Contendobacter sp.]
MESLVVIVPVAIYGVYGQYRTATRINPEILKTLVQPYTMALQAGDHAAAYQRFTSAGFRMAHSLEMYPQAQQINLAEFGPLVEVTLKENDPFQSAGNLFSGRRDYQGGLVWRGQRRETWVNWEVVREDGTFKIDAMEIFHERLMPRMF